MAKANAKPDWYLSSEEYGYPNVTGANAGVILEIRRERTIELLQEGHRFEDLVRWKAGTCIDQAITGMYFPGPGEYDLTGDGKADLILYAKGSAKPSADEGVYVYELARISSFRRTPRDTWPSIRMSSVPNSTREGLSLSDPQRRTFAQQEPHAEPRLERRFGF